MRAARQHVVGEPLVVDEVAVPEPGAGETLVRVTRAAVNPLDVWIAAGTVGGAGPLPRTFGGEGAGVTADGRRVVVRGAGLGLNRDGTYAEHVVVPDEILVPIPQGVSDAGAAGLGVAGVTALDCVALGGCAPGDTVLVLGASGGVAHLALQLARAAGARVIAQTSTSARVGVLEQHADAVVVADAEGLVAAVRAVAPDGVDVVLDGLSGPYTQVAVRTLARRGRIVLYGASAGPELTVRATELYRNGGSILGYSGLVSDPAVLAASLVTALDLVAAGTLVVTVADELPLADVNEAFRRIRAREAGGKLLLVP